MSFTDQYIQEKSLEIYNAIKDRKVIYLDLKYWIMIRDCNPTVEDIASQISIKITELYQSGKCIFPISEPILLEILKQDDAVSRNATLKLVERLSEGVAIIGDRQRIKTEFSQWVLSGQNPSHPSHTQKLVWSSTALVLGYFFYAEKAEELPLKLRRLFLDFVCGFPISELLDNPATTFIPFKGKDDVAALNKDGLKMR